MIPKTNLFPLNTEKFGYKFFRGPYRERQFFLKGNQLATYHSQAGFSCDPNSYGSNVAACSRYCSLGCTSALARCTMDAPGAGFSGGTATSCEIVNGEAEVTCICM